LTEPRKGDEPLSLEGESALAFPCDFPVKVMGRKQPGFAAAVIEVFKRHAPDFDESTIEMRLSREETYISLTMTVHAVSRDQLDALYRDLCDHPMVAMVL
jgi:putative lipoic acid-binding regulatory protein